MLYETGVTIFVIVCILTIAVVLMQKSHGGFFSGPANSDSTLLFGGSAGSEVFQKITWVLGALLISLTFTLSLYKAKKAKVSRYYVEKTEKIKATETNNKETVTTNNSVSTIDIPVADVSVTEEAQDTPEKEVPKS